MSSQQVQRVWSVCIGIIGPLIAYWFLWDAIDNVGTYYEGNNSGIRFAIVILVVSALATGVSGFLLAKQIIPDRGLERAIIQAASLLTSVCLFGIAWLWSMIPNLQAEGYRGLPDRGTGVSSHQVLVTLEGSSTFVGVAVTMTGLAALSFAIAGEFNGIADIAARIASIGAVWASICGLAIATHGIQPTPLVLLPAVLTGLLYAYLAGVVQTTTVSGTRARDLT